MLKHQHDVVADVFSRNCACTCPVNTQTSTFDALSHVDLFSAQRNDPTWSNNIHYLESGDNSNLLQVPSLSHYFLLRLKLPRHGGTVGAERLGIWPLDQLLFKTITLTDKHESSRLIHQQHHSWYYLTLCHL